VRPGGVEDAATGPIPIAGSIRVPRRPGRRSRLRILAAVGIGASVAMSVAAITITLTRTPATEAAPTDTPTAAAPGPVGGPADKALCIALVPLVDEEARLSTDLANKGTETSVEFGAAVPGYKAAIADWLSRIEPVLDAHTQASGYLTRGMHRYIDAERIYAMWLTPGKSTGVAGSAAWSTASVGLGAAREVCTGVGVDL